MPKFKPYKVLNTVTGTKKQSTAVEVSKLVGFTPATVKTYMSYKGKIEKNGYVIINIGRAPKERDGNISQQLLDDWDKTVEKFRNNVRWEARG